MTISNTHSTKREKRPRRRYKLRPLAGVGWPCFSSNAIRVCLLSSHPAGNTTHSKMTFQLRLVVRSDHIIELFEKELSVAEMSEDGRPDSLLKRVTPFKTMRLLLLLLLLRYSNYVYSTVNVCVFFITFGSTQSVQLIHNNSWLLIDDRLVDSGSFAIGFRV